MPFTLAHAAAVLPFTLGRPGRWLVPAALVIGSLVPDLPYFVPTPTRGSDVSHAWYGPITLDLILGVGVWMAWELLLRVPLTDLAPRWLRLRLRAPTPLDPERCFAAGVSIVIGATTHVLWDAVTHSDRWGTTHLAILNDSVGGLPVGTWLQFGSGLLGLIVLIIWFLLWIRRTPQGTEPLATETTDSRRRLVWGLLAAGVLVVPAVIWTTVDAVSLEESASLVMTRSTGVFAGAIVLLCLIWPSPKPSLKTSPKTSPKADPVEECEDETKTPDSA